MNFASANIGRKIAGVGVDIVYLPRFAHLLEKYSPFDPRSRSTFDKITQKFMHEKERFHLSNLLIEENRLSPRLQEYMAGIWALKECSLKALCCRVSKHDLPPAQVLYAGMLYKTQNDAGVPRLEFDKMFDKKYPKYQQLSKMYGSLFSTHEFLVSLSHDKDYLIAITNLVERE
ncbi:holo-[acyl-carrier-protein] synthase [Saccharomyces paradoxus]|uniref:Mitochondrial holo-[acyl-carrier-protein] synthase n=1 Tax=Saccharomyces paradoxus TaxID=27291 RepID=A0A8B8V0T7_SACPA|nr:Ppt2 [Saccharomyces paradoxus]QHS76590.1 Ppt2 [Saccharomyces paradoxus]